LADYNQNENAPKVVALRNIDQSEKIMFMIAEIFVVCVRILRHVSELIGDNSKRWAGETLINEIRKWIEDIISQLHDFMRVRYHEAKNTLKSEENLIDADKEFVRKLMEEFEKAKDELNNWKKGEKNLSEILDQLASMVLKLASPRALKEIKEEKPPHLFGDRSLISIELRNIVLLREGLKQQIRNINYIITYFTENELKPDNFGHKRIALTGPTEDFKRPLEQLKEDWENKKKELEPKLNDISQQTTRHAEYWSSQLEDLAKFRERAEEVREEIANYPTSETFPEESKQYYLEHAIDPEIRRILTEINDFVTAIENILWNLRFDPGISGKLVLSVIDAIIKGAQLSGTPEGRRRLDNEGNTVEGLVRFLISEMGHVSRKEPEKRNEEAHREAVKKIEDAVKAINRAWKKSKLNRA
ncbi:hypothetical protein D6764_00125, partial [Candidatus Woesearchaeota archaeon]